MNDSSRSPTCAADPRRLRSIAALFVITAFAALAAVPTQADNGGRHGRGHEHRHSDGGRREWRDEDRSFSVRPAYPQPYVYAQPVYVPPPVYYAPRPSPGISLFFPLDLR